MGGWIPGETFEEVFGLRPELFAAFRAFHDLFFERALVDPVLLELCRLRVAQAATCASRGRGRRVSPRTWWT